MAGEAKETVENFFADWLFEPCRDVIRTIRAGGEEGVIVRKEGVAADLDVRSDSHGNFDFVFHLLTLAVFTYTVPRTYDTCFGAR